MYLHRMKGSCDREGTIIEALDAWDEAGRRLQQHDPEKFEQILSITRAFVALFERGVEDREIFASRVAQILPGRPKVRA